MVGRRTGSTHHGRSRWRSRVLAWLDRERFPRFSVTMVVLASGVMGLLVSWGLRAAGMSEMWLRYPLAVLAAYVVFVLLLWSWLRDSRVDGDVPDVSGLIPNGRGPTHGDLVGGGGDFAGGGASGDFADASAVSEGAGGTISEAASVSGEALGGAAAEGCGVVVLAGAVIVAVGAMLWWVLSLAPVLAAEIILDALLAAALYRRLRRHPGPWLLQAIVRRTRVAFLVTAVTMAVTGAWMNWQQPGATTLGEYWMLARR